MSAVIVAIRKEDREYHYSVNMTVNGESKTFQFVVNRERPGAVSPDNNYYHTFARTPARGDLCDLVVKFHRGEQLDFPLDLIKYAHEMAQKRKVARAKMRADDTREEVKSLVDRFDAGLLSRIDVASGLMGIINRETVDVAIASLTPELYDFFLSWAREHCHEETPPPPSGPIPSIYAAQAAIREWMARNQP